MIPHEDENTVARHQFPDLPERITYVDMPSTGTENGSYSAGRITLYVSRNNTTLLHELGHEYYDTVFHGTDRAESETFARALELLYWFHEGADTVDMVDNATNEATHFARNDVPNLLAVVTRIYPGYHP
jgi:hypothetical protein